MGVRAALERLDIEATDDDVDAFLGQLKGGSAANVSLFVASSSASGFHVCPTTPRSCARSSTTSIGSWGRA